LQPWLKTASTCPTCRFALPTGAQDAAKAEYQALLQEAAEALRLLGLEGSIRGEADQAEPPSAAGEAGPSDATPPPAQMPPDS